MSRENVDAVRAVYERWAAGDLRAGLDLYDADVLLMPGPDWMAAGRYLGTEQVTEFMRVYLDAWRDLTFTAEEVIEAESSVVVAVHQRGIGRESGAPAEWSGFHVWTFRGRLVIRLETFQHRRDALAAVDVRE